MKKYFLFFLTLNIVLPSTAVAVSDSTQSSSDQIEKEKEIENNDLFDRINRNIDLYQYDVSFGSCIPLNFKSLI